MKFLVCGKAFPDSKNTVEDGVLADCYLGKCFVLEARS
jgi:hypothetical protein